MKNVIVTGGIGLIGSWMIQELLSNGIRVTAIVGTCFYYFLLLY